MKSAYNKDALNRIASQDKLDSMIVLTTPGMWISIIGALAIFAGLILWGFFGKLPESVDTQGIFLEYESNNDVYAQTDGFVTAIYVDKGDHIAKDQVIASVGTEEDLFKIRQLDTRIQYVENMTFDSELDEVTSDTQQMAQIKLNAKSNSLDSEKTKASLELAKEKIADAKEDVEKKEDIMLKYKEEFYSTLSITDQKTQVLYSEADSDYEKHVSLYEQYKNSYISAVETYNSKRDNFNMRYEEYDSFTATDAEKEAYVAALADLESARIAAADYKFFMEDEEKKLKEANSLLDTKRKEYLEYLNSISGTAATNTMASTEYSESLQDYFTAKNNYNSLLDEIDKLELQSSFDEATAGLTAETYEQQFNNEKSVVLFGLKSQRDELLNKETRGSIKATSDGEIYDVMIKEGSAVNSGTEVVRIFCGEQNQESIVCFVKLADAKKIHPGMSAHVFPSTVNKEEYGHIEGQVVSTSAYVLSYHDMMEVLGTESLVETFSKEGSVLEVRVLLSKDPNTTSGFKWSSNKGADVDLSEGTIVSATIVTDEKHPIDILIPYLKQKLKFASEENEFIQ